SGGARVDCWAPAWPPPFAAPFLVARRLFFFLFFGGAGARPQPPQRALFFRAPCRCARVSGIACCASRHFWFFLYSVSARRRVSSVFTLTIGTPCKALEDRGLSICPPGLAADQKDILASNFSLAAKLGHASSE